MNQVLSKDKKPLGICLSSGIIVTYSTDKIIT